MGYKFPIFWGCDCITFCENSRHFFWHCYSCAIYSEYKWRSWLKFSFDLTDFPLQSIYSMLLLTEDMNFLHDNFSVSFCTCCHISLCLRSLTPPRQAAKHTYCRYNGHPDGRYSVCTVEAILDNCFTELVFMFPLWLHRFLTLSTLRKEMGIVEKEGGLPGFDTDIVNSFFFFFANCWN